MGYISDNAKIGPDVHVDPEAFICGSPTLEGEVYVFGRSMADDDCHISGYVRLRGGAVVRDEARIDGSGGPISLAGDICVQDDAHLYGGFSLQGHGIRIGQGADIFRRDHVIYLQGLIDYSATVYRTKDGARVQAGCQNFTLDEAERIAKEQDADLPPGWKSIRRGLLAVVATWHSEESE